MPCRADDCDQVGATTEGERHEGCLGEPRATNGRPRRSGPTRNHRPGHLPGRVGQVASSGEGAHPRGRRDRGRAPTIADGRGRSVGTAHRGERGGHPPRCLRGADAALRVVPHVAHRPPRRRTVRGLHLQHRPCARTVLPALARCDLRGLLRGPVRGERSVSGVHGVGSCPGTPCPRRPWSGSLQGATSG